MSFVVATKTLANIEQYPLKKLDQFSSDLVQFYHVIAQDIGNPELLRVPLESGSQIARKYAKKVDMTDEEAEELLKNLAATRAKVGAARSTAAEMVRGWKSDGVIHSNEDAFALLLLFAGPMHEALWRGCVEGGEIAGEMRTAAAELLRQHQLDRKDTDRCFEFIKKELSENHARLWLGSVKGSVEGGEIAGEMVRAALALRDNLIKYGVIEKTDYEGCIALITAQLSEKHANMIRHSLRADALNEARRGTQLDTDGQLFALQARLSVLKGTKTSTTNKLNDVPEHLRDVACHVYACGLCETLGEPVVRYDHSGIFKKQQ